MIENRIFIVGCPRSGTTLLQSMLAAHGTLYSPPETHLLRLGVGRKKKRIFAQFRRIFLLKRLVNDCAVNDLKVLPLQALSLVLDRNKYILRMIEILDKCAERGGYEGWLEKTPEHLFFISHVHKLIPNAKFIHVVRDGQCVSSSIVKMWMEFNDKNRPKWQLLLVPFNDSVQAAFNYIKSLWSNNAHDFTLMLRYSRYVRAIQLWNESLKQTLKYRHHRYHYICKYKDLIGQPKVVLSDLCAFLGIEFKESMLEFGSAAKGLIRADEPWKTANVTSLNVSSDDKYRELPSDLKYMMRNLLVKGGNVEDLF